MEPLTGRTATMVRGLRTSTRICCQDTLSSAGMKSSEVSRPGLRATSGQWRLRGVWHTYPLEGKNRRSTKLWGAPAKAVNWLGKCHLQQAGVDGHPCPKFGQL